MGQREAMSKTDILKINRMYNCWLPRKKVPSSLPSQYIYRLLQVNIINWKYNIAWSQKLCTIRIIKGSLLIPWEIAHYFFVIRSLEDPNPNISKAYNTYKIQKKNVWTNIYERGEESEMVKNGYQMSRNSAYTYTICRSTAVRETSSRQEGKIRDIRQKWQSLDAQRLSDKLNS